MQEWRGEHLDKAATLGIRFSLGIPTKCVIERAKQRIAVNKRGQWARRRTEEKRQLVERNITRDETSEKECREKQQRLCVRYERRANSKHRERASLWHGIQDVPVLTVQSVRRWSCVKKEKRTNEKYRTRFCSRNHATDTLLRIRRKSCLKICPKRWNLANSGLDGSEESTRICSTYENK